MTQSRDDLTVIRHPLPAPELVDLNGEEELQQTMVSVQKITDIGSLGHVTGELIRWIYASGDIDYEVRINGLQDPGGIGQAVAYTLDYLESLTEVCTALRDEWRTAL
ncbi:hypothetical protein ACNQR7_03535 [Mycolicibacterium senegalense]